MGGMIHPKNTHNDLSVRSVVGSGITGIYLVMVMVMVIAVLMTAEVIKADEKGAVKRPNILFAISDDQSWRDASAYGSKMVQTPVFDGVAGSGVLLHNTFCGSPGCSPSRASLLTGRHTWMIEEAGTHASYFSNDYVTFPDLLESVGYFIGYTGKGWGPGNWQISGRTRNPAGPYFGPADNSKRKSGYVASFDSFFKQWNNKKDEGSDSPFFFWFGSHDPHRSFDKESGIKAGKKLSDAEVPGFLPDSEEVRSDLLDYAMEIQRFDSHLGEMIEAIRESGELDNTLIIVTSDNGMAFPRAKANCYEYGIHMPMAISWPDRIPGNRHIKDLIGFVDVTSTILEAASVSVPPEAGMSGRSFLNILASDKSGILDPYRTAVYSARERHSSSRYHTLSYPQRCIRTHKFLYIINFKPERWPAGPSRKYSGAQFDAAGNMVSRSLGPEFGGFHDIDACPTLDYLIKARNHPEHGKFLTLATGKRPHEELFHINDDPDCLQNLADDPAHKHIKNRLRAKLWNYLSETGDPRVHGNGDIWESYPRVSSIRWFEKPDWAVESPNLVPAMPWLDARRPREK